ncbi:MAG: hypothetical protein K940chlam7_01089 [Chlamydiae bacterium]|nr:hypothetical protein [Chlamydiota bacterium]
MPHDENIVSNVPTPTTWMENLESVIQSPPAVGTAYLINEMFAVASNAVPAKTAEQFNEFFASYNRDTNPFTTTRSFLDGFKAFLGDPSVYTGSGGSPKSVLFVEHEWAINAFLEALEIGASTVTVTASAPKVIGLDVDSGDWKDIFAGSDFTPPTGSRNDLIAREVIDYFHRSFDHFLANYPYNADGSVGTSAPGGPLLPPPEASLQFFARWSEYMGRTAKILESTDVGEDVPSYEAFYNGLFGADPDKFRTRLQEFVTPIFNKDGTFIPSQEFNNWVTELRNDYIQLIGAPEKLKPRDLLIIDRILKLLIGTIGILQNVSAAQAQRLGFYADWQRAYTDMLTRLPIIGTDYVKDIKDPDPDEAPSPSELVSEYQTFAGQLQTKIRARRDVIGDEAKAMQSAISQSQDAANQQTNMATAIIQQLSTILSQIFR